MFGPNFHAILMGQRFGRFLAGPKPPTFRRVSWGWGNFSGGFRQVPNPQFLGDFIWAPQRQWSSQGLSGNHVWVLQFLQGIRM